MTLIVRPRDACEVAPVGGLERGVARGGGVEIEGRIWHRKCHVFASKRACREVAREDADGGNQRGVRRVRSPAAVEPAR
jgi:hypothetical protein